MDVRNEVVELAAPLADELGYEVVDVDFVPTRGRSVVRIFLDRPGGVTLDDCSRFSRRLGDLLEMNQTFPGAYVLEVSSPGIERRLRTAEHFRRFLGRRARIDAHTTVDGRRHVEGVLRAAADDAVTLELDGGGTWTVPLAAVKPAHLIADPWGGQRPDGDGGGRSARRPAKSKGPAAAGHPHPRPRGRRGENESE
jgi:ribosome maturation factor RimP